MSQACYARGRDWHQERRKPEGGYCFIHANSIDVVWRSLLRDETRLLDIRVWLAAHEMSARRCQLDSKRCPKFSYDELSALVGGAASRSVRSSVRRLAQLGLLELSDSACTTVPFDVRGDKGRPIPVPRRFLRRLARSRGRAFIATGLGHLIRCLFYRNGVCRSGGWCKSSWIVERFGVAIRSVKEARATLVSEGWLAKVEADQMRLNRFGCAVVVSLDVGTESALRQREMAPESAPPKEHKELSLRRVDHQKPARTSGPAGARSRATEPDLNAVTQADLNNPWRLAALFKQARERGWVKKTEAEIMLVFSAAAHALRVGTANPPGLFRWLVAHRQWAHLACVDEDTARRLRSQLLVELRATSTH